MVKATDFVNQHFWGPRSPSFSFSSQDDGFPWAAQQGSRRAETREGRVAGPRTWPHPCAQSALVAGILWTGSAALGRGSGRRGRALFPRPVGMKGKKQCEEMRETRASHGLSQPHPGMNEKQHVPGTQVRTEKLLSCLEIPSRGLLFRETVSSLPVPAGLNSGLLEMPKEEGSF